MVRLEPIDLSDIHNAGKSFESQMVSSIRTVMKRIAAGLNDDVTLVSVDDLAVITPLWTAQVDSHLLNQIGNAFTTSADNTREHQKSALASIKGITAAATPKKKTKAKALTQAEVEVNSIPKVSNQLAQNLMETARNRMVNVGNDVWEQARGSLVDGLKAGEGINKIRDRIVASTNIAAPRAGVVARTEISHAMNQGTLQQMKEISVTTMTKEWIATDDDRTRPEHAEVNGETIPIDGTFSIGEDPGDAVNCRCTLGFNIPDDDFESALAVEAESA